jgi:hypothetical protein
MTDLDGRAFIRRGNALVPADVHAEEFLCGLPEGREVLISVRRARSVAQHRWFFALLRKVVENSEQWGDEDDLLDDLKIAVGHHTRKVNPFTGEVSLVARSINFASMPQDPFRRFLNRCLHVLGQHLGVAPETLMAEVQAEQPPARRRAA